MTVVFMFPGQSSRDPAMIERIVAAWPPARAIVAQASEILGRDLARHYRSDNPSAFVHNRDIQVGVFLCCYLHRQALAEHGIVGDLSLGLSLGEYSHLLHIGALDFESALRLVNARGVAYDAGPPGMMVSIFPLPLDQLQQYLDQVKDKGRVAVANLNSPTQNVIAGDRPAVEAAIALIEDDEPAVQAVVIEGRIPMHTEVFRPVAAVLRPHLDAIAWRTPLKPYLPNITGTFIDAADGSFIAECLERHVYQPVLWRRSVDTVVERYPDACFVEVGPGAVLFNLLQKRWHANRKFKTDDREGFIQAVRDQLVGGAHAA